MNVLDSRCSVLTSFRYSAEQISCIPRNTRYKFQVKPDGVVRCLMLASCALTPAGRTFFCVPTLMVATQRHDTSAYISIQRKHKHR